MKIELHILQNFAPSNLNRDDTGAPKDCEFGGHRRARISSQCQKRAVRELFRLGDLLADDNLAARTKRLASQVADVLREQYDIPQEEGLALAMGALEGVGLRRAKSKGDGDPWKTEYLLFVPRRIIGAIASLLHEHRAVLTPLLSNPGQESETTGEAPKKTKKNPKRDKRRAKGAYPPQIRKEIEALLRGAGDSADLALFGRMIADRPEWNVDAACQVAHAISTHRVQMDFDFYTAVDDFSPTDNAGSDMMGTIQFNSSCFYRYAVLDTTALAASLDGNTELARVTADAFVRAFVEAIPSAKQNSMAAHNPPSYVLAVVRPVGQSVSLANAFVKPARARETTDLVEDSIDKLENYFGRMRDWLGDATALTLVDRERLPRDGIERVDRLRSFYERVVASAFGAPL